MWDKKFTRWIGSKQAVVFHTVFFVFCFFLIFLGYDLDTILLFLTTLVSLEAIYLAIFIQMTVNNNTESLKEVEEDIDQIHSEVDEIHSDVEEISEDIGEIQSDVDEIQADVDEISIEHLNTNSKDKKLDDIEKTLYKLIDEISKLKNEKF